jgi:hypothetical protein
LCTEYIAATTKDKRRELLLVMSNILNFTEEDKVKAGLINEKSWLSIPFFRSPSSVSYQPGIFSILIAIYVSDLIPSM